MIECSMETAACFYVSWLTSLPRHGLSFSDQCTACTAREKEEEELRVVVRGQREKYLSSDSDVHLYKSTMPIISGWFFIQQATWTHLFLSSLKGKKNLTYTKKNLVPNDIFLRHHVTLLNLACCEILKMLIHRKKKCGSYEWGVQEQRGVTISMFDITQGLCKL